jgi:PAS domain S-box-containing protein
MKSPYYALLTPDGIILFASTAALGLVDANREEVVGRYLWDTEWLDGASGHKEMVETIVRTGIPEQRRFEVVLDKDVRAFDVLMSPVRTSDGTIIAITVEGFEANHVLNEREKAILEWTAKGKTSWEIARIIGLSQRTVEWHATRAREKLEVNNTMEAVLKAIKSGLIDP